MIFNPQSKKLNIKIECNRYAVICERSVQMLHKRTNDKQMRHCNYYKISYSGADAPLFASAVYKCYINEQMTSRCAVITYFTIS